MGLTALAETQTSDDFDGDGIPDATDLEDDNDSIPDTVEGDQDSDGDGQPKARDLDSDNDGQPDSVDDDTAGIVDDSSDAAIRTGLGGGAGCSITATRDAGSSDPLLALLVAGTAGLLWRRRRSTHP